MVLALGLFTEITKKKILFDSGIRSLSSENVSAKIVEEERKVDMVTRILKETMTGIFHSRQTEPSAD